MAIPRGVLLLSVVCSVQLTFKTTRGKQLSETPDLTEKVSEQNSKSIRLPPSCRPEFRALPNHTMCLFDSPDVVDAGISMVTKNYIIKEHNRVRGSVIPPATDLVYLVWDGRLSELADKRARLCLQYSNNNQQIPNYGASIGQNSAWGYQNWTEALAAWSQEADIYRFGEEPQSYLPKGKTWADIGHYTQMVYNTTVRLGCGFAKCLKVEGQKYPSFYFCNYAAAQGDRQAVPYTAGSRCSACPGSCVDGVCTCGGRICVNGGRLNLTTCSCECPPLYSGVDCKKVICPPKDAPYCGRTWTAQTCDQYANVPQKCPYMCGKCPVPVEEGGQTPAPDPSSLPPGPVTQPPKYVSDFGCSYTGERPSSEECSKLGEWGRDESKCASRGGKYGCQDCRKLGQRRHSCPVMCGLCPGDSPRTEVSLGTTEALPTNTPSPIPPLFTCSEAYRRIPGHTMCLQDNPYVIESYVTESDKDVIMRAHNRIRGNVNPPATDLPELVWDEELSRVAAKWARQCPNYHDKVRNIPSYGLAIGQNAAWGALTWKNAINVWYEEVKKYRYGEDPATYLPEGYLEIGHYTQLVYNTTVRVGCGFARCQFPGRGQVPFYFCNYAPGQGLRPDEPYINGTQCSACPDHCENGVCKCGGKLCRNHGTLNVTVCECECQPVYGGEECEQVFCPTEDAGFCGDSLLQSSCSRYANAASPCPYMCGLCPVNGSDANINMTFSSHITSSSSPDVISSSKPVTTTEISILDSTETTETIQTPKSTTVLESTTARSTSTTASETSASATTTTKKNKIEKSTTITINTTAAKNTPTAKRTATVKPTTTSMATSKTVSDITITTTERKTSETHETSASPAQTTTAATVPSSDIPDFTTMITTTEETSVATTAKMDITTEKKVTICPYSGMKANRDTCLTYGSWGQDRGDCQSRGGPWGCEQCSADPEFARSFCPVMCGICEPLCDGLVCEHGGTLDVDKCHCHCAQYFTGEACQTVNCPGRDVWYCGVYPPPEHCHVEPFRQATRQECPYMCGIC